MIFRLQSITQLEDSSYRVILREEDDSSRAFTFTVERGRDLDSVLWQDELAAYLGNDFGPVSPLLEAVLAFHRARRITVPER